jgi:SAM-dependent methyltransferase
MSVEADFACRLCGGRALQLYYTLGNDGQFRYFKCEHCALVNYDLAGGLDQAQYTSIFYDPADGKQKKNLDKDQSFRFIQKAFKTPGSLLDIGCGTGRLMYLAKQAGWWVKGLELSADMAEFVRQRVGADVQVANFLEMVPDRDDLGRYDLVVLRHVLEHLPDSVLAMEKISALLKPGGCLLLEIPNIEGLSKKLSRTLVTLGLHKRRFGDDFVAGHCNEFSLESMRFLARRTGFVLVRWETYSMKRIPNWIYNRVHVGNKARALLRLNTA